MSYGDLLKAEVPKAELQQYLAEGGQVAITIRIPKNLRDASKEVAGMRGVSFSALVRQGMIQQLVERD